MPAFQTCCDGTLLTKVAILDALRNLGYVELVGIRRKKQSFADESSVRKVGLDGDNLSGLDDGLL
jgi:hypothetical protein